MLEEILSIVRKCYVNSRKYKYIQLAEVGRTWIDDPMHVKITLARDGDRKFLIVESA